MYCKRNRMALSIICMILVQIIFSAGCIYDNSKTNYTKNLSDEFGKPEDYGAIGDGINDDTASIQRAIYSHKNIILGNNKTYYVKERINIPSNTSINFNNSLIKAFQNDCVFIINAENVSLSNGNIQGRINGINGTLQGIKIVRSQNVDISNMCIKNCETAGIYVRKGNDINIRNCLISDGYGNGLTVLSGKVAIENVLVKNIKAGIKINGKNTRLPGHGILLEASVDENPRLESTIKKCEVYDCYSQCIQITAQYLCNLNIKIEDVITRSVGTTITKEAKGNIIIKNVDCIDAPNNAVIIRGGSNNVGLELSNFRLNNYKKNNKKSIKHRADILVTKRYDSVPNVKFNNFKFYGNDIIPIYCHNLDGSETILKSDWYIDDNSYIGIKNY